MRRSQLVLLLALIVAVPSLAGASFFTLSAAKTTTAVAALDKPCFVAGKAGYKLSATGIHATHIVRVDNTAANPSLRLQLVDDAAAAEFVLVDDAGATIACNDVSTIETVRIDDGAASPDMTVAISRAPADHKIYLHSQTFSETDAAALFAVIWRNAGRAGSLRTATR